MSGKILKGLDLNSFSRKILIENLLIKALGHYAFSKSLHDIYPSFSV